MPTRDGVPFPQLCRLAGLPEPVSEYRFEPTRRWRFDYAWPAERVALEVDGGAFVHGRHTRGRGYVKDMEKINAAQLAGWLVVRCVPAQLLQGATFALLERALSTRGDVRQAPGSRRQG